MAKATQAFGMLEWAEDAGHVFYLRAIVLIHSADFKEMRDKWSGKNGVLLCEEPENNVQITDERRQ